MTDLEVLFLVLAVIYCWECMCWTRRGSVGFLTWLGRRWRLAHPAALLGNQQGGFIFASPVPPLGFVLVGNQFPLSLSADTVLAFVASNINPGSRPEQTGKMVRFDDVRNVEVRGRKLCVNGEVFLRAATPTFAEHLAGHVRGLMKVAAQRRPEAIDRLVRASFDSEVLERRWQEFRQRTGDLRLLTNCLFGYLFIFAPILIRNVGLSQCWLGLLLGLLLFTLATALFFRRAHKHFFPAAEEERFTHFVTILLSPATTIRAQDVLSRPLLETFHPLTIARKFCVEPLFRSFARKVLLEVRHPALPLCPIEDHAARSAEAEFRSVLQGAVEKFLKQNRIDPDELARPAAPADDSCQSYCPRCEAQFTTVAGVCADCGGLPLARFPSFKAKKTPAEVRT